MGKSLKGKELGTGITQRKEGKYSAKFTSKSGKRVEKYFEKLSEAKRWLEEAKYKDAHENIGSSTSMTVDAWFHYWITEIKGKTVRRNTIKGYSNSYEHHIKDGIGTMIISEVKPMHCQNILNIMDRKGYASSSMNQVRICIYHLFSSAEENGIIPSNPVRRSVKCSKKTEKKTRVLTLEEQEKFLEAAKETRYYAPYLFLLHTGLRAGEMIGLQWEDIDFPNRMIQVRHSMEYDSSNNKFILGEPKSKSGYRKIPMTQVVYELLLEIWNNRKKQKICVMEFSEYVFLNRNGKPNKNCAYDISLKRICKNAGIPKISMHTLRHTFATRCIESGMKPKTLQKILGHANISITMDLYVHVTEEEKEKEMKRLEEIYQMK